MGSQSTEESRPAPGEALTGLPSTLCQYDLQSRQPYAVQAKHQVCGPPTEESSHSSSADEGQLCTA
jgi:hypothetical protein